MKKTYDAPSRTLTWIYGGSIPDLTYTVPTIVSDDPTADHALVNGYAQKIGDAGAIARSTETGKSATDADKRAAMQTVVDRLVAGEWNATAKTRAPKTIDVGALVAAIAGISGKGVVAVRAYVEGRTEEQRAALAGSKQFAAAYATALAQARPATDIDTSEIDNLPE